MALQFTKMQGCANDYIYLDCFAGMPPAPQQLAVQLSRRRFSVGADGLICICKSEIADARMRMFNADGSESAMCGNGIRCVAQWLFAHGRCQNEVRIETGDGVKALTRVGHERWAVEMGTARFLAQDIPMQGFANQRVLQKEIMVQGKAWVVSCVSMGNPHCVTLVPDVQAVAIQTLGPAFEHHAAFPQRVNTEFIQGISPTQLKMRVWERGSGETLACGTGAAASVAACVANGICPFDAEVTVQLLGGELQLLVRQDFSVRLTGAAQTVYDGVIQGE